MDKDGGKFEFEFEFEFGLPSDFCDCGCGFVTDCSSLEDDESDSLSEVFVDSFLVVLNGRVDMLVLLVVVVVDSFWGVEDNGVDDDNFLLVEG